MAHTDSCKIQVIQFTKKLVNNGMSIREACQVTEKESDGIPAETVRRWWKATTEAEADKQWVNNDPPTETPEITDASGGPSGPNNDLFPADPIAEIPEVTVDPIAEVQKEVTKGTSVRKASRKVAEKTGESPQAVRRKYQKKVSKSEPKQEPLIKEIVSEPQPEEETPVEKCYTTKQKKDSLKTSHAMQFAMIAISQLERIKKNDPNKEMAFNEVREFLNQNS